jgi:uncharacterized damage-inducible protein DinB
MNRNDVENLFDYNRWANALTLDAVASLSQQQFISEVASSYRSVRNTLTHILSAEWVFLMRCHGESPKQMLDPAIFPDLKSIRIKWNEANEGWEDFIDDLSEESLRNVIAYTNFRGELWKYPLSQIVQHTVNHSTYHRGQVTTLLRTLGANPVMTDYLAYWDVHKK